MKKVILIPLIATSALLGCQDGQNTQKQAAATVEQQVVAWAGKYQGTTPCMGCLSRCDECPGMAVALELHEDMTYTLVRESLSGHNQVETLTGVLKFTDAQQGQIELVNVTNRNLMYVDLAKKQLEIREDLTAKPYQMQSDFILSKNAQA